VSLLATEDLWVAVNNRVSSHPVAIIEESIISVVAAWVGMAAMPEAGAIVIKCGIAENTVVAIMVLAGEVAIDDWSVPASHIVTIVDIVAVDAVVAVVQGAVYHDAVPIEDYGVFHKTLTTVNYAMPDMGMSSIAAAHIPA